MTLLKSFLLTFFVATSITVAQKNDASKTLKPVLFSAMGCGPYSTAAEVALAKFIVWKIRIPRVHSSFTVAIL